MAKALELLRGRQQFEAVRSKFLAWNSGKMLPQMDHCINDISKKEEQGQALNQYSNCGYSTGLNTWRSGVCTEEVWWSPTRRSSSRPFACTAVVSRCRNTCTEGLVT
jgi:hypothetical protein